MKSLSILKGFVNYKGWGMAEPRIGNAPAVTSRKRTPGGGAFSFFFALSVAIINKYCKQYASKKGKRADGGGGVPLVGWGGFGFRWRLWSVEHGGKVMRCFIFLNKMIE